MVPRTSSFGEAPGAGAPALPRALERRVTYLLRRVTEAAGRMANAELSALGFDTRHYTVLVVVAAGAGTSQQTVADTLGLDRATVVALVDALESQGLVRRVRSREDRRANAIELTTKGQRMVKRADRLMEECELKFVGVLDAAEREQLRSMLERLLAANRRE